MPAARQNGGHVRSRPPVRPRPDDRRPAQARRARPVPGRDPAVGHRRGPHGRLDGRRGAAPDPDHRPLHVLVAQPPGVLGEGRDVRAPAVGPLGRARLRRRHRAGQGRPGRRAPATPATAPASTPTSCRPSCWTARRWSTRRRRGRRDHRGGGPGPGRVRAAGPRLPAGAGDPAAARRRRDPGRRLPQARRRPAGHVPARVRRARPVLVALVVRGRAVLGHAVRAGRPGGVDRRPAARRADRRRPAGGAGRDLAGAARARRPRPSCPTCRRSPAGWSAISATTWSAGSSGCPTYATDDLGLPGADHARRHRRRGRRPLRGQRAAGRQRAGAAGRAGRRARRRVRRRGGPAGRDDQGPGHAGPAERRGDPAGAAGRARVPHAGRAVPAGGQGGAGRGPGRRGVPGADRAAVRDRAPTPTRSTSTGCCGR